MIDNSGSPPADLPLDGGPSLKIICYRGGLVTFRIPADWTEEYEPEGGGTFYEDSPNSPTLRLRTITLKSPSPVSAASAAKVLSSQREAADARVHRLPSGCALIRSAQSAVDRGHRIFITYWAVAHAVPPYHVRIANFSYTLLQRQRVEERFQRESELLDREVCASVFSSLLGDDISHHRLDDP